MHTVFQQFYEFTEKLPIINAFPLAYGAQTSFNYVSYIQRNLISFDGHLIRNINAPFTFSLYLREKLNNGIQI